MFKFSPLLFLLFPIICSAQFSITGKILNQIDTKPVSNATVLLNNTTIGDKTGNDGIFHLKNIAPGQYDLVISFVGFETYSQPVIIKNSSIDLSDIIIFPKTTALNTVTIKADRKSEKKLDLYYDRFKAQFLGRSEFAAYCKIINPEMLDFGYDETTNTLTASSVDFLQIENDALGYKISYLLTNFEYNENTNIFAYQGSALFTEMKGSPSRERDWAENRKLAYEGSSMRFFRSALRDRLTDDGFRVLQLAAYQNPERPNDSIVKAKLELFDKYNKADSLLYWKKKSHLQEYIRTILPKSLTRADLIVNTNDPGVFILTSGKSQLPVKYDKKLLVMYDRDRHFLETKKLADSANLNYILTKADNKNFTLLKFKDSLVFFDLNGRISDPNDLFFSGAWSQKRVADLLPIDYQLEQNKLIAPDTITTGLENKIASYSAKHNFEKIHLHLDRPRYGIGDTIWFKAYVLAGSDHKPSSASGIMYAELFNSNDSLLNRLTLPLDSGISKGDFAIPATYIAGTYHVRAYTNWMRNEGDYYFDRRINIGGIPTATSMNVNSVSSKLQNTNLKSSATNPDVQFFPEGGDLVRGLRSKVAFKVTGSNGSAKDVNGVITDENGNEVAKLQTQHSGMGEFPLTPQAGKHYSAKITFNDNSSFIYKLPDANEKGFVLTINNAADSIYVKVAINDLSFNSKVDNVFYLIAQSAGKIFYTSKGTLENKVFTARIEKSRFPTGIVQFTLFSQMGEPLNERIVFVQNRDKLKVNLSLPAKTFAPFSKVKFDLDAANEDNKPNVGSFSIAVTDETKVPVDETSENTIFTDLLLTSELKGYIESPNYYFINQNDKTRSDLDLIMLTQGYRRFDWKKILADGGSHAKYPVEKYLSLSGVITTPDGKPIAHGKVRLTSIKDRLVIDTVTDANGNFIFTNLYLSDSTKVVINAQNQYGGNNVKISIHNTLYPGITKSPAILNNMDGSASIGVIAALKQTYADGQQNALKNIVQLKEVKIKSNRNDHFNPTYSQNMKYSANLNGPGNADEVVLGDKFSGCINLAECLAGKTFGLTWEKGIPYNNRSATNHLITPGKSSNLTGPQPMAVIIDGAQRGPADLTSIDPTTVYSVEVLRSGAFLSIYGSNAPNGALIITMKHGSDFKPENVAVHGLITYKVNGYYKAREFYSPKYNLADSHQRLDDRKTIYWNPNIITDANGKASLEYFNASGKGSYRMVVEGIDGYGNPARQVLRYTIE